jgi:hypothetical protein
LGLLIKDHVNVPVKAAKGALTHQVSSQTLIDLPSPTSHLYPKLTALAVHITPFQKMEGWVSSKIKYLDSLYCIYSISFFQVLPSPFIYLLIHDPIKQIFTYGRFGIPKPPKFFSHANGWPIS